MTTEQEKNLIEFVAGINKCPKCGMENTRVQIPICGNNMNRGVTVLPNEKFKSEPEEQDCPWNLSPSSK